MKNKRFSDAQIMAILKQAESGMPVGANAGSGSDSAGRTSFPSRARRRHSDR